jgi:IS30 family transposase
MSTYHQLSQQERYNITALMISRRTNADIARVIGRSPSSISRELARNRANCDGTYRADLAHSYATARRRRARRGFHLTTDQWEQVITLLKEGWSPEQISNVLKIRGTLTVSHQTIYKYILNDRKHGGRLFKLLRIMPKVRRKRYNTKDSRGILPGKRHISTRPYEVETRKVLGHWEGDTVIGSDRHHCVLTLVERKSGLVVIKKLNSRTTDSVTQAALPAIRERRANFKTLTLDNGTEFHDYKILEDHFPLKCYFATPYHSWERGSNENLNGLIRQYLPKGMCMSGLTQAHCDHIAFMLNSRPRKRHGYRTPQEVYDADSR